MPEFILDHGSAEATRRYATLDPFTAGYLEAAFFTSTGTGDDEELEHATLAELADEAWRSAASDCANFQLVWAEALAEAYDRPDYDPTKAGRDFWYTRNGHGCGFWDRTELAADDLGEKLTLACKGWRERDMYRGDDGLIYFG